MEIMQSQMYWGSSNTFDNAPMMLAEDCNILDSSQHQQLFLNEDMFPPHITGTQAVYGNSMHNMGDMQQLLFNDDMIPSHRTGTQADYGNDLQNMDSLEELLLNDDMIPSLSTGALADHGNLMQTMADPEQLNWEPAEVLHPTIQTVPEFSTLDQSGDQSGETKDYGNDMQNMDDLEELLLNDDMIRSHSSDALADHGNLMQTMADPEQLNWEPAEVRHPSIQTMPEFSTLDQSGDQSSETMDLEEDGEDDQEDLEEDGEFSEECVDGATAVLSPRPVLPPGKKIGVSFHKKNKQWEAHLWVRGHQLRGRKKKGVQIFLGTFNTVDEAKQAHDRAAIKLEVRTTARGKPYPLNFPEADHASYIAEHSNWSPRDFLWKIRRLSNKFSKGKSSFKGVSVRKRAAKRGQPPVASYESKLSQTAKESGDDMKRTFMLGNFASEEEAAKAYDRALLFLHQHLPEVEQLRCVTNYRPSTYSVAEIEAIGSKLAR